MKKGKNHQQDYRDHQQRSMRYPIMEYSIKDAEKGDGEFILERVFHDRLSFVMDS
jgi:hypothetical protein